MENQWLKLLYLVLEILLAVLVATALKLVLGYFLSKLFDSRMAKHNDRTKKLGLIKKLSLGALTTAYWVVLGIVVLDLLGLNAVSTALLTFAGIGSLVLGLAAQDLFKDMIAGFILIFEDKIGQDDFVKIDGIEGFVEKIRLRNIYIRTYEGQLASIPCGTIGVIINYARGKAKALVEVTLPFSEDVEQVKLAVLEAGETLRRENPAVSELPVIAGITELRETGYRLRVFVETEGMEYWAVQRALNEAVLKSFQKHGISVLAPIGVKVVNGG